MGGRLRQAEKIQLRLAGLDELLRKAHPARFESKTEIFMFMAANRGRYRIATMCRLFGVTRAGFYAWKSRSATRPVRGAATIARMFPRPDRGA